jgi:HEPN domain-containing protein
MTEAEKKHLGQWTEKAEHDLIAAKLVIEHQLLILDIACFHCLQAVKKYLKTFLKIKQSFFLRPSFQPHYQL